MALRESSHRRCPPLRRMLPRLAMNYVPRGRALNRITRSSTGGRPRCLAAAIGQLADGGATQQARAQATVPLTHTSP